MENNPLTLISKYRPAFMGIAIIWTVIFHFGLDRYIHFKPLSFIFEVGYGGVDIFFFLTGFGLYYSLEKQPKLNIFYWNRLMRIMPAYIIFVTLDKIISHQYSITEYALSITTLDLWFLSPAFNWYIQALVMFYIFYPIVHSLIKRYPILTVIIISLISVIVLFTFTKSYVHIYKLPLARIPIFCLGALMGKLSFNNIKIPKNIIYLLYILAAISILILYDVFMYKPGLHWKGLLWYPFITIVPAGLIMIGHFFEKIGNKFYIVKMLSFFGKLSLELFLAHHLLLHFRDQMISSLKLDFILSSILMIILSVLLSYIVFVANNKFFSRIKR